MSHASQSSYSVQNKRVAVNVPRAASISIHSVHEPSFGAMGWRMSRKLLYIIRLAGVAFRGAQGTERGGGLLGL